MAKKMQSGKFDLNDLADQLGQMKSSAAWAASWA